MAKIKRWAPIAHGFNRDPEIRELRKRFGDWMAFVWIEMVSIGDLNDGEIKGSVQQIADSLAYVSLWNRPSLAAKRIAIAMQFMANCGWIRIQTGGILIANHSKYHPFGSGKPAPPNYQPTNQPKEEQPKREQGKIPITEKKDRSQQLNSKIKAVADLIYRSNPDKFTRLIVWIKEKQKHDVADEVIWKSLDEFWKQERKAKIKDWWPYLERICRKEYGRWNEALAAKRKEADAEFIKNLITPMSKKMEA